MDMISLADQAQIFEPFSSALRPAGKDNSLQEALLEVGSGTETPEPVRHPPLPGPEVEASPCSSVGLVPSGDHLEALSKQTER